MAKKKKKKEKKEKKEKKIKSEKVFKGNLIDSIQAVHFLYEKKIDEAFDQFDLSNEQFRILNILNEGPEEGYSLRQIRESLPNQTSNATRLVEKLRIKKLVAKKSSKLDKRELRISLTSAGLNTLSQAQSKISSINKSINGSVKSKAIPGLVKALGDLDKALV